MSIEKDVTPIRALINVSATFWSVSNEHRQLHRMQSTKTDIMRLSLGAEGYKSRYIAIGLLIDHIRAQKKYREMALFQRREELFENIAQIVSDSMTIKNRISADLIGDRTNPDNFFFVFSVVNRTNIEQLLKYKTTLHSFCFKVAMDS